jgi:hypothetical protein
MIVGGGASAMDEEDRAAIAEKYPEEWIARAVTAEDEIGQTLRGRVIAHGKDRQAVSAAELSFSRDHLEALTHLFFNGPVLDQGADGVVGF